MSDSSKKTIEKSPSGEYIFTQYGEFLTYFHAHLEIFKRFYKNKNFPDSKLGRDIPSLKAFMASNIKNLDQYFPNIPKFAEIMAVSSKELSEYLNQHFLEILPVVQNKFKIAEIEKLKSSKEKNYQRITEEIIENTGFTFPRNKRFILKDTLVVLEDQITGEIIEPKGIMAGMISTPTSKTSGETISNIPTVVTKAIPDDPVLEDIVKLFGSELKGSKLSVQSTFNDDLTSDKEENQFPKEGVLEDIEDLDFGIQEEYNLEKYIKNSSKNEIENVLDDIGGILDGKGDLDISESSIYQGKILPEVEQFSIQEFFSIIKKNSLSPAGKNGESNHGLLSDSQSLEKAVVEIRNLHLKELKKEIVDWDERYISLCTQFNMNTISIATLKEKVVLAHYVKIGLDRGLAEFKKGSPEFIELAKRAMPHIQSSFYLSPDYDAVLERLKIIVWKVMNPIHRKELIRVLTLVIQFLKSKA